MLYEAGAKEVHVKIACPEIRFPDFYGVDTPTRKELLAANKTNDEIIHLQRYLLSKISDKFKYSENMKVWNPYNCIPFFQDPISTIDELFYELLKSFDLTIFCTNSSVASVELLLE